MTTPRKMVYNKKGYWKRRFKAFDKVVLNQARREKAHGLDEPISNYFELGHEAIKLGINGEKILERAIEVGMEDAVIRDMYDMLNLLESYSEGLQKIAQAKWDVGTLDHFPVYRSNVPEWNELAQQSAAVREMQELLDGQRKDG